MLRVQWARWAVHGKLGAGTEGWSAQWHRRNTEAVDMTILDDLRWNEDGQTMIETRRRGESLEERMARYLGRPVMIG